MLVGLLLVGLVAATPLALAERDDRVPMVTIRNGTLLGRSEALGPEAFLSIPYAQPPTGALRLANPLPVQEVYGDRDASYWRNTCPGIGPSSARNLAIGQNYTQNEDCLTLGLVRPAGVKEDAKLPVLVWLHGGGWVQGTAVDPRYNMTYLVKRSVEQGQPIVRIFIGLMHAFEVEADRNLDQLPPDDIWLACYNEDYKLSLMAGQAARDAGVLNLGLKDQRLALHWLQANVGAFGGDPKKVALWGQSVGGGSTVWQAVAYGGRNDGLFRAAIIDSFAGSILNGTIANNAAGWSRFVSAAGCGSGADELNCLRNLDYKTFYAAAGNASTATGPVVDGDLIPDLSLLENVAADRMPPIPIISGIVKDEATFGVGAPTGSDNVTALFAAASRYFTNLESTTNATVARLLELYPDDPALGCPFDTGDGVVSTGLQDKRSNAMVTDWQTAGARFLSAKHSAKAPVYKFFFDQVNANTTIDSGVAHLSELPYFFGVLERTARGALSYRPSHEELSKQMQIYLINFVNTLDPNSGAATPDVAWPTYDKAQQNLVLKAGSVRLEKDDYRSEGTDYILKMALGKL